MDPELCIDNHASFEAYFLNMGIFRDLEASTKDKKKKEKKSRNQPPCLRSSFFFASMALFFKLLPGHSLKHWNPQETAPLYRKGAWRKAYGAT
ncbi:hypothetical protein I7I53_01655 [Histoplasma capsulatum var. duboisii H88]|uniref:Uncharacterized protein n=1 Tax=Ajellomyces capsulatus (strain H88) TaxID=544711 RepID=A0A8A1LM85_AJEC8|nr:hypothetical protein I7I53_01655 [Histoplasma capsulatum var. duboisii H88]